MRYNTLVRIDGGAYAPPNSTLISSSTLIIPHANSLYVNEHGDKMEGVLNMNNNKITNVAEPTEFKDVSTKSYVDTAIKDQQQSINDQFLDRKGFIRFDKLPTSTTFHHLFTLNVGNSENARYKISKFQIPLLYNRMTNLDLTPKYPKLKKDMINIQITPFFNTMAYTDEICMILHDFDITFNGLDIHIHSFRLNGTNGWGLLLQAHLSLTICFDGILKLNPI